MKNRTIRRRLRLAFGLEGEREIEQRNLIERANPDDRIFRHHCPERLIDPCTASDLATEVAYQCLYRRRLPLESVTPHLDLFSPGPGRHHSEWFRRDQLNDDVNQLILGGPVQRGRQLLGDFRFLGHPSPCGSDLTAQDTNDLRGEGEDR